MNRLWIVIILLVLLGCEKEKFYIGSTNSGFDNFPKTEIKIKEVLELSKPFLDKTYELRLKNRRHKSLKDPVIWITLKGQWFYVVKDNYPSHSANFYLKHAVRINSKTGKIIEPE